MAITLSLYLWADGQRDAAFEALDAALSHFKLFDNSHTKEKGCYTAPLIRPVRHKTWQKQPTAELTVKTSHLSLAEDWPWWSVPEYDAVKPEITAVPRWDAWVDKLRRE